MPKIQLQVIERDTIALVPIQYIKEVNAKLVDRNLLIEENEALYVRLDLSDSLAESRLAEIGLLKEDIIMAGEIDNAKDGIIGVQENQINNLEKKVKKRTIGGIVFAILCLLL